MDPKERERIQFNADKLRANGRSDEYINDYIAKEIEKAKQPAAKPQPQAGPPVSRSEGMAQGFGQGVTMGFGDELTAGVRAAAPGLANWMMSGPALQRDESIGGSPVPQTVSTAGTFDERYAEERAKEHAKDASFAKSNPYLSTGSKVAGGVANAIATGPLLKPFGLTMSSGNFLGNTARGAAQGAIYGGVAGYGEGEGDVLDWQKRGPNALLGAAIGTGAGALAPTIGAAATRLAETGPVSWLIDKAFPVVRALAPKAEPLSQSASAAYTPPPGRVLLAQQQGRAGPGGTGGGGPAGPSGPAGGSMAEWSAIDRLATAVQRSGRDPSELIARANQLGPQAVLADLDPQILAIAEGLNILPGRTKNIAPDVLRPRNQQTGTRVVEAFEGAEPPPSTFALRGEGQAFDSNLRAVGQRAYGAMDEAGLTQTPELRELYDNPYVAKAIDNILKVGRESRQGTTIPPDSPVEVMHKVKRAIEDMGFPDGGVRKGADAQYYRNLASEFVAKLKAANPALAEADRAYAQAASLPEHFDVGRNFMRKDTGNAALESSAPALDDLLRNADQQQVLATRSGATNAVRDRALESTADARAVVRRVDQSGPVQQKLVQLYGPERAAEIIRMAEREGTFAHTHDKILTGSDTARRAANALEQGAADLPPITPGTPGALQYYQYLRNWLNNPNVETRDALGQVVLTMNPAENRRILEEVARRLAARQSGNALRTTVTGGAAQAGE